MVCLLIKKTIIEEEEDGKFFMSKYGCFFEEFKEGGVLMYLFYPIFILRRVIILVCVGFMDNGIFQISLSIVFSAFVFFI